MRRLGILIGLCGLALLAGASTAAAGPILVLQQGADVVTVAAGLGSNTVTYMGAVGDYNVNFTVGVSSATPYEINMDLSSLDMTTTGDGGNPLTITLSDADFSFPNQVGSDVAVSGVVGGTVPGDSSATFQSWVNPGNTPLGFDALGDPVIPAGNLPLYMPIAAVTNGGSAPVGFTASGQAGFTYAGPFSLFSQATVEIPSGSPSPISFDLDVDPVPTPEPVSLTLFGTGLAGLAALRRRSAGAAGAVAS